MRTDFPRGLTYLEGGIESGFKKASDRDVAFEVTMYQVKGRAQNVLLKQVNKSRNAMNSGDVFILDTEDVIYQWNGSDSNPQVSSPPNRPPPSPREPGRGAHPSSVG